MLFCRSARERGAAGCAAAQLIVLTAAGLLVARAAAPQFTSFSHDPRNILEGNWQSCREGDGRYTERVYDHVVNGVGAVRSAPRTAATSSRSSRASRTSTAITRRPTICCSRTRCAMEGGRARQRWEIPSLEPGVHGERSPAARARDCDSWFIVLEPLTRTLALTLQRPAQSAKIFTLS